MDQTYERMTLHRSSRWGWGAVAVRTWHRGACPVCGRTKGRSGEGEHFYPLVGWVCTGCAQEAWAVHEGGTAHD